MKILVTSATTFEQIPFIEYLDNHFIKKSFFQYSKGKVDIFPLVSGVGLTQSTFALTKFLSSNVMDLAIQIGIGGAYTSSFELGKTYNIISEQFGDLGAADKDGSLIDIFDLGLFNANQYPFTNKVLVNPEISNYTFLPSAKGITLHEEIGRAHV